MEKSTRLIMKAVFAVLVATTAPPAIGYAQGELMLKPDISYTADDKRDPFIDSLPKDLPMTPIEQTGLEGITPPTLTIQGIFWGAQFPQAIINDKVVKVGDSIDGAQLVGIEKNGITIRVSNREFRLPAPGANPVGTLKKPDQKEDSHEPQPNDQHQ